MNVFCMSKSEYLELEVIGHSELKHAGILPHLIEDPKGGGDEGRGVIKVAEVRGADSDHMVELALM